MEEAQMEEIKFLEAFHNYEMGFRIDLNNRVVAAVESPGIRMFEIDQSPKRRSQKTRALEKNI